MHTSDPATPHWSAIVSFIDHLTAAGYAVAVFTPEELGKASADKVTSHMIDHGWQLIDTENAPPLEVTPEEEEAWKNWKEQGVNK
jgi:hypothetical protein